MSSSYYEEYDSNLYSGWEAEEFGISAENDKDAEQGPLVDSSVEEVYDKTYIYKVSPEIQDLYESVFCNENDIAINALITKSLSDPEGRAPSMNYTYKELFWLVFQCHCNTMARGWKTALKKLPRAGESVETLTSFIFDACIRVWNKWYASGSITKKDGSEITNPKAYLLTTCRNERIKFFDLYRTPVEAFDDLGSNERQPVKKYLNNEMTKEEIEQFRKEMPNAFDKAVSIARMGNQSTWLDEEVSKTEDQSRTRGEELEDRRSKDPFDVLDDQLVFDAMAQEMNGFLHREAFRVMYSPETISVTKAGRGNISGIHRNGVEYLTGFYRVSDSTAEQIVREVEKTAKAAIMKHLSV